MQPTRVVQGVAVPTFLYGTAWKEDRTAALTDLALEKGFRGIDTANQRRHYCEAAVGEAVKAALESGEVVREALFLQTKFTYPRGQDHRLPYDADADPATQVRQSFASSLEHLGTSTLDSYVLHGPSSGRGITDADRTVWRAMEEHHAAKQARLLGVSNVCLEQLEKLFAFATVKPAFVQNRCYASEGWDRDVRKFCKEHEILYQGFSLLTANPKTLTSPVVQRAARRLKATPAQIVFRFALEVGMVPLTGTSSGTHMEEDLASVALALDPSEVTAIERVAG